MPHLSMSVCSAGLHKRVVTGFGRQGASGRHPCPSLKLFDNFKAGYLHRDMTTRSRPNPSRTGSTNCRNPSPCPGMRACRPRQLHSHRGRLAHSRPQRLPLESFGFWILSAKPTVSRWWKNLKDLQMFLRLSVLRRVVGAPLHDQVYPCRPSCRARKSARPPRACSCSAWRQAP